MYFIKSGFTLLIELVVIWLFSKLVGWSFIESFLLGSLGIFGIIWLLLMSMNQSSNSMNATSKGWYGLSTGEIRVFRFRLNAYITGSLILVIISLITTAIYYLPYFT
ncbi:hypothetical protein ACFDTO_24620 [Microbacteriaceae bacterium 4G12]